MDTRSGRRAFRARRLRSHRPRVLDCVLPWHNSGGMKTKSRFLRAPVEPFAIQPDLTADEVLVADGADFVSGAQSRDRAPHLGEDARRRLHDLLRHGRRAERRRPAAGRRAPDRRTATSTASSRPAPTSTTTCTKRAAAATTSARRTHDDAALQAEHIDRVYDTYASEDEFVENDEWIAAFAATLERRPYTSREFLYQLGEYLWKETERDGILTAAYRANVPIFCPAIADSSIGMGLSQARQQRRRRRHTSTSSATSSSRRTSSSAGRARRRSCSAAARRRTSSTRPACRRSSTTTASAATATRCRS